MCEAIRTLLWGRGNGRLQAKETVDLLRMARAIPRFDALDAEIDADEEAQ